jgi:hypothetical protein
MIFYTKILWILMEHLSLLYSDNFQSSESTLTVQKETIIKKALAGLTKRTDFFF